MITGIAVSANKQVERAGETVPRTRCKRISLCAPASYTWQRAAAEVRR